MRVTLAGYQGRFPSFMEGRALRSGTRPKHLPKFGVDVRFFDPWTRLRKEDTDLFHLFAANIGDIPSRPGDSRAGNSFDRLADRLQPPHARVRPDGPQMGPPDSADGERALVRLCHHR